MSFREGVSPRGICSWPVSKETEDPSLALTADAARAALVMTGLDMSPKKKSEYAVPKLKDFSVAALDKEVAKLRAGHIDLI